MPCKADLLTGVHIDSRDAALGNGQCRQADNDCLTMTRVSLIPGMHIGHAGQVPEIAGRQLRRIGTGFENDDMRWACGPQYGCQHIEP